MSGVMISLEAENKRLKAENERLRFDIAKLRAELATHEALDYLSEKTDATQIQVCANL